MRNCKTFILTLQTQIKPVLQTCLFLALATHATTSLAQNGRATLNCSTLQAFQIDQGSVSAAEWVAAGEFRPAGSPPSAGDTPFSTLPEFCRVSMSLHPSDDSDIKLELWLPRTNWNGKYMAVGNGAFTGSIRYSSMHDPLRRGYAVSSTDTGHSGNTASFAIGHPEKLADFGWRAEHEMAEVSKRVIDAFYSTPASYSYWNGCSAGGRQAMVEAEKFPLDFDGIIAGAPGLDWTGRAAAALRVAQHLEANPEARLLENDRRLLHDAVIQACDANDGVQDRLISQPLQCHFEPAQLLCANGQSSSCLTAEQVDTVEMLYSSPVNPDTGRAITGLLPGSELGWTDLGWTASARATGLEQYRYIVYEDESWTIDQFDFDRDIVLAESMDNNTLNALDPDLEAFMSAGGKLIQYHGWVDPQISPNNATQYYERVVDHFGGRAAIHDNYRLFMVPGMEHCRGGPGPDNFDAISALEDWVEHNVAPDAIVAEHYNDGAVDRSRPLCPFPEIAVYDGNGDIDDASNFQCRVP